MDSTSEKYPETTFSRVPNSEILGRVRRGSFCHAYRGEDIRISAAATRGLRANNRPRTARSLEEEVEIPASRSALAYQHPVHTLVVNVTTAAMAAFVAAALSLPPAPRSPATVDCVGRVVFRAMISAPRIATAPVDRSFLARWRSPTCLSGAPLTPRPVSSLPSPTASSPRSPPPRVGRLRVRAEVRTVAARHPVAAS